MRALGANLLTLVQCPALWFMHILCLLIFALVVLDAPDDPAESASKVSGFILLAWWIGVVTASLVKEAMTKPFTFCLPGRNAALRTFVLAVGFAFCLLLALVFLALHVLPREDLASAVWSGAALCLCVYLAGALVVLVTPNATPFWGIPLAMIYIYERALPQMKPIVESAVCDHPLRNTAIALLLLLLTWYRLGNGSFSRILCGGLFLPLQSMWSKVRIERYNSRLRVERMGRKPAFFWRFWERRGFTRMNRRPYLSRSRFISGTRYALLGVLRPVTFAGPIALCAFWGGLILLLGYSQPIRGYEDASNANILFIIATTIGIQLPVAGFSTLLLPAGRRDRFWCSVHLGLHGAFLALLICLAIYLFSTAVDRFFPEVTVQGEARAFMPVDAGAAILPFALLPVLYVCQFLFPRRAQIAQVVFLIVACIVLLINYDAFLHMGAVPVAILLSLSWGLFVLTAHYRCMHTDLVVQ